MHIYAPYQCDWKHERTREQGWWTVSNMVLSHRVMYNDEGDEGQRNHDVGVMHRCCR